MMTAVLPSRCHAQQLPIHLQGVANRDIKLENLLLDDALPLLTTLLLYNHEMLSESFKLSALGSDAGGFLMRESLVVFSTRSLGQRLGTEHILLSASVTHYCDAYCDVQLS